MHRKIALITGGSRGLGRSAALHLAEQGVGTIITWQSRREEADSVVDTIRNNGAAAAALQLDTTESVGFASFRERLGVTLQDVWNRDSFDYLVNNAGTGVFKPFLETTEEELDRMFAVHLKGVFFLTQTLLPLMEDDGRVLNVSSGLARFTLSGYSAYASMKGAVEVLTRYLAKELGPRGIAVNAIAPGAIETDFAGGVVRDNPELNKHVAALTAMGRAGRPDDIGAAVASLLTTKSQWMTGQRIEVSGGQNL